MKKKIFHLVYILLFLGICLAPILGMAVFGPSEAVANELPVSKPALWEKDGSLNRDVLDDTEDYIAHRFAFRPALVTAWAKLNSGLLHTSVQEQVILGERGWLFYASTAADYMGECAEEAQLHTAAVNLALMQEYVQGLGGDFVFTVAPNKNSLYGQYMPDRYPAGNRSNGVLLRELLGEMGVSYADLFAAFRAADEELYFRTDSHWNGKGAALAADVILGTDYSSRDFGAGQAHLGDLYEMLYPAGKETEADYVPAEDFTFQYATEPNGGNAIRFETMCEDGEGSLVCWRDSFGISLHSYLAQQFAAGYFTRSVDYDMTLAAERNADVVVIELVERELCRLWENAPVLPAPVRDITAETCSTAALRGTLGESGEELQRFVIPVPEDFSDADSRLYVQVGDTVYEGCGFFTEEGLQCSAYLSADQSLDGVWLITKKDGSLLAYPVILE